MLQVLIVAILAVLGLFTGLTVVIIVGKAWREAVQARRRRRRRTLEPEILRYAHGGLPSVLPALGGGLRLRDRAVVEEILLDHVQRIRGEERERLGRALDELGFVDRHIEGLRSPRWWRRAEAAEKLGLAGARRSHESLVAVLDDPVPEVRIRAAKALGAIGGKASVAPLIEALSEPNRWSTIRIADILAEMGRPVVAELIEVYPRLGVPARLAAIDILGRIRPLDAAPWLRERLGDEQRDVRARAAHALGSIGEPGSGPSLAGALHDPEWPVRAMAAKALGRVHWKAAAPVLAGALRDRQWWVRANAAEALRSLGEPGRTAIEAALDDDDRYARAQAVRVLQESGAINRRVEGLASADPAEAEAAAAWLRRVARAAASGVLRDLAVAHPEDAVRERLQAIFAEVGAPDPAAGAAPPGGGAS